MGITIYKNIVILLYINYSRLYVNIRVKYSISQREKKWKDDSVMDGTWIEVRVITKSEALEPISGIFYSCGKVVWYWISDFFPGRNNVIAYNIMNLFGYDAYKYGVES